MKYLNDSGEIHEVESNKSGEFPHVSSQPARIPSPRSMLSCDKRLQPSGLQENVFCKSTVDTQVTTNNLSRNSSIYDTKCIPMPTFARRSPTTSSFVLVDIPQSSMVGQQR